MKKCAECFDSSILFEAQHQDQFVEQNAKEILKIFSWVHLNLNVTIFRNLETHPCLGANKSEKIVILELVKIIMGPVAKERECPPF